jgi:ribonuclease D
VLHLLQLSDWALEECRRMEGASDERDPETAYERLPRAGQLDPRSRAVAKELAAWRERTAQQEDKPVGTILPDPALVEIAKRKPGATGDLEQIRGLHGGHLRRRGQGIVDAVARGRDGEPIAREGRRPGGEPGDAPLISLVESVIRSRALDAGLAYELVASRAELEQIVIAVRRGDPEPAVRALAGWRRELVGEEIAELLAGRRVVTIADGRLDVTTPG